MQRKHCAPCSGSGKVLGLGMTQLECPDCEGAGKITTVVPVTIKDSRGYKSALTRLKKAKPDLSDEEAQKMLDDAFEKEKPKRKRCA